MAITRPEAVIQLTVDGSVITLKTLTGFETLSALPSFFSNKFLSLLHQTQPLETIAINLILKIRNLTINNLAPNSKKTIGIYAKDCPKTIVMHKLKK
jgi:hypothetical protein